MPDAPRILYLPIYEPGSYHARARANKHGLRTAFEAVGAVEELDYLASTRLIFDVCEAIERFQPTLIFTQIQGPDVFTPADMRGLRDLTDAPLVNWNGDYWPAALISAPMLAILREIELQLVVNATVLPTYAEAGVRAAFWPFGYETPSRPLPLVPRHDVVYLGNCYHEWRVHLYDVLRGLPCNVGIYGSGWPAAQGECTYDFAYGEALYQRAAIAISDNRYTDAAGYLSNRPFQAMAAGCFVLQQWVDRLEEFTGLRDGEHYVSFREVDELPDLVAYWLDDEAGRQRIAAQGQAFVRQRHSFATRVQELFEVLLPEVAR